MSESNVLAVTYICEQAEHHCKFSHQEELRELLKRLDSPRDFKTPIPAKDRNIASATVA